MEINTHEPGVTQILNTRMVSGFIQRVKGAKMVLSTCWGMANITDIWLYRNINVTGLRVNWTERGLCASVFYYQVYKYYLTNFHS